MKRKNIFVILPALLATIALASENDPASVRGRGGYPYIQRDGRPMLLVCGASRTAASGEVASGPGIIHAGEEVEHPVIRSNPDGINRVVWEERGSRGSRVFAGHLRDGEIIGRRSLSGMRPGSHFSPDLSASPEGDFWAVWVHRTEGLSRIAVRRLPEGKIQYIPGSSGDPHAPRVMVDGAARPWVIWAAPGAGPDRIWVSSLTGGRWTASAPLSRRPDVPHFHPVLGRDDTGYPLAAWSAFDGEDYEIQVRIWDGTQWSRVKTVTRNRGISDVQPTLALFGGEQPLMAWTRAESGRREIVISRRRRGEWSVPVRIVSGTNGEGEPVLLSTGDRTVLAWSDRDSLSLRELSPSDFEIRALRRAETEGIPTGYHLEKEKFIAFGDSITFGSMNGPYQAEGYPPRLQALLNDIFTDPRLSNRGVPGEPTWEALSRTESVISADLALYFLLMEGTNDVSTSSYSMETTAFNLRQILLICRDYGVYPLVSTIIPRARSRWTATARERTLDLNQKILDLSRDIRVPFVDMYAAFDQFPGGHETLISDDNLHPNLDGYQRMAETWHEGIARLPFPPLPLSAVKFPRRGEVRVTWEADPRLNPNADVIVWRIYRKREDSGTFQLRGSVPDEALAFTDQAADQDVDYDYALSALNSGQVEGPLSAMIRTVPGDPEPPVDVTVSTVPNKAFLFTEYINRITWNPNPLNQDGFEITRYRVYRKPDGQPDGAYTALGDVDAGHSEFLDRGHATQAAALGFTYGVSALDAEGNESPIQEGQT